LIYISARSTDNQKYFPGNGAEIFCHSGEGSGLMYHLRPQ